MAVVQKNPTSLVIEKCRQGGESINWIKGNFLGKGGFAKVYQLTHSTEGTMYAAKLIPKCNLTKPKSVQKLKNEISIHRSCKHKHIVQFIKHFEDPANVYILLEYCNHRSLMELIKKRKRLLEVEVRYYISQICSALEYLHKNLVIHRDLKLGNVFLQDMQVKLGDFGLSTKLLTPDERKRTLCGTPNYIAPEILTNTRGHSYEVDIWAIGVIMYTLLVGIPPFETDSVENTYNRIKSTEYSYPSSCTVSECGRDLINLLLQLQPERRPSVKAILTHSFYANHYTPSTLPESALVNPPKVEAKTNRLSNGHCVSHTYSPSRIPIKQNENHTQKLKSPMKACLKVFDNEKNQQKENIESPQHLYIKKKKIDKPAEQEPFVLKWVDYSNMYGLGYQLSNGSVGCCFNDSTRMLMVRETDFYYFDQSASTPILLTGMSSISPSLEKKIKLASYFGQYLEKFAGEPDESQDTNPTTSVIKWHRTDQLILFQLGKETFQANFFDHCKLVVSRSSGVWSFTWIKFPTAPSMHALKLKQEEKESYLLQYINAM